MATFGWIQAVSCALLLTCVSGFLPSSLPQYGFRTSHTHRSAARSSSKAAVSATMTASSSEAMLQRREALLDIILKASVGAGLLSATPGAVFADELAAKVTDKVYMDISVQGVNAASSKSEERDSNLSKQAARTGRIVIGLFGEAAPGTAAMYKELFAGTLTCGCQEIEIEGATAREQLNKKQAIKKCKASVTLPVNLEDSSVWSIVKDQQISFGRLKGRFLLREAPANQDAGAISHDRAGLVTTKRGGGQFEFSITPKDVKSLDAENIVFGQVLEGLDLIQILNDTPVKQYAGGLGAGSKATACMYGGKDAFCGVNKPLQRIIVTKAGLVE